MEIKKEMNNGRTEHWRAPQIVNLSPLAVLVQIQLCPPIVGPLIRSLWTHKFLHETAKLWYNSTIK